MDVRTYMEMYSAIHKFCTRHLGKEPREDLYTLLSAYLKKVLSTIHKGAEKLTKEQLLDYYNEQWSRFIACSRLNHYLWMYLQRHWLKRELDEGKKVYLIFDLHLREWKLEMLDRMHENLAETLLRLIRRQRDGEYVEQLPRKSFINSVSKFARTNSVVTYSHVVISDSKKV